MCFKDIKSSKRAISKNNSLFCGRNLRVSRVKDPNTEKPYKKFEQNGFCNVKNLKSQASLLDNSQMMSVKQPTSLKGTKKLVRKEQVKLQNKRKQRKESNTKTAKKSKKKAKLDKD